MTNGSGVCSLILCGGEGDAVQLFVLKELLVGFLFFFFFLSTHVPLYLILRREVEMCVVFGTEICNICGGSLFLWELFPIQVPENTLYFVTLLVESFMEPEEFFQS